MLGFEITGELGWGGLGTVYRARKVGQRREVAVKVLASMPTQDGGRLERFKSEARRTAGLTEAHVVPVLDVQESGGVPVVVMPLIDGSALGQILSDRKAVQSGVPVATPHPWARLDERSFLTQVLSILDQVVDGVAELHRAGVFHRDVKPANILVDARGRAWLSDCGLAELSDQGSPAGGAPGKPVERPSTGTDIDCRTDIARLGATIYQALTLNLAFGAADVRRVAPGKLQPHVSRDLEAVVLRALQSDRDDGYGSAAEFREDWRRVREGLSPRVQPLGSIGRASRAVRQTLRRLRWWGPANNNP
jgi:serine/threonine protein kinase